MSDVEFTSEEKKILVHKIQNYFHNELSEEIGPYHYNQGLKDARTLIEENVQNLSQTFYEMEKPTEFIK